MDCRLEDGKFKGSSWFGEVIVPVETIVEREGSSRGGKGYSEALEDITVSPTLA